MPYKFSIFVPKIRLNRMATFSYRIRTTRKGIPTKVLIRFNVDRHTSFYADTQYLVLSDAWDDKKQTVKSRFTFTDDFTEQQGRELTKNLSELRSHILGEIAKDPEHAMTKTRLEKIIYSFHHPRSLTSKPPRPHPRIARRLHCPLHARDGGGHPAEHPQTPLRPLDHQELQGVRRAVRRVLQSQTQAVRLCRHRLEVLRRLRRLVHRQELLRQYDRPPRQGAEDHHARGPARRVCTTTERSRAASSAC